MLPVKVGIWAPTVRGTQYNASSCILRFLGTFNGSGILANFRGAVDIELGFPRKTGPQLSQLRGPFEHHFELVGGR